MASNDEFQMAPDDVVDATKQLDALADRIQKLMDTETPNLTTTAPGRDEVSQRVVSTLNAVHGGFATSTDQGVTEIRELAATLRAHSDRVVNAEQDFAV